MARIHPDQGRRGLARIHAEQERRGVTVFKGQAFSRLVDADSHRCGEAPMQPDNLAMAWNLE